MSDVDKYARILLRLVLAESEDEDRPIINPNWLDVIAKLQAALSMGESRASAARPGQPSGQEGAVSTPPHSQPACAHCASLRAYAEELERFALGELRHCILALAASSLESKAYDVAYARVDRAIELIKENMAKHGRPEAPLPDPLYVGDEMDAMAEGIDADECVHETGNHFPPVEVGPLDESIAREIGAWVQAVEGPFGSAEYAIDYLRGQLAKASAWEANGYSRHQSCTQLPVDSGLPVSANSLIFKATPPRTPPRTQEVYERIAFGPKEKQIRALMDHAEALERELDESRHQVGTKQDEAVNATGRKIICAILRDPAPNPELLRRAQLDAADEIERLATMFVHVACTKESATKGATSQ